MFLGRYFRPRSWLYWSAPRGLRVCTEGRHISICSDNQAALRALVVLATRSQLVGECKEALGRLAERNRLRLL